MRYKIYLFSGINLILESRETDSDGTAADIKRIATPVHAA